MSNMLLDRMATILPNNLKRYWVHRQIHRKLEGLTTSLSGYWTVPMVSRDMTSLEIAKICESIPPGLQYGGDAYMFKDLCKIH